MKLMYEDVRETKSKRNVIFIQMIQYIFLNTAWIFVRDTATTLFVSLHFALSFACLGTVSISVNQNSFVMEAAASFVYRNTAEVVIASEHHRLYFDFQRVTYFYIFI